MPYKINYQTPPDCPALPVSTEYPFPTKVTLAASTLDFPASTAAHYTNEKKKLATARTKLVDGPTEQKALPEPIKKTTHPSKKKKKKRVRGELAQEAPQYRRGIGHHGARYYTHSLCSSEDEATGV